MPKKCEVPISALKKKINLSRYKFETTEDIQPLNSVIGQDRAVSAINFGLAMNDPSYNLFVTGFRGTGRTTIVHDLLRKVAFRKEKPPDWLYVYNFDNPDEPKALSLPNRKARLLMRNFHRVIDNLRPALRTSFESEPYNIKKNQIIETTQQRKREIFSQIETEARKKHIQIKGSSTGFQTIPMVGEKAMSEADYQNLSDKQRAEVEINVQSVQKMLKDMVMEATTIDREAEEEVEELNEETARFIVESQFHSLRRDFRDFPNVAEYIEEVIFDIIQNVYAFLQPPGEDAEPPKPGERSEPRHVDKYRINHVVDNARVKGAPIIYEMNPTYNNLFGRIEKKSYFGYLYTDYTMIKAGSLLKANGGYLILDIEQVLHNSFVYDALKRALRSRFLIIEDINELYGVMTSAGLKPMPIKLNVKVIIIGQSHIYHLLHTYDEDFRKIFKVRADFDYEVRETASNLNKYIKFISRVVREEKLKHFDRSAVEAVIEHAYRLTDHQQRLSIRFTETVRLIRESSYWAGHSGSKFVTAKHIEKALQAEKHRSNLSEEKIQTAIQEKTLQFDTDGAKVGQINGLAVYNLGDYSFGKPARITASTYIGSRGIINIEREAKLSGKLHDKGMLILSGFFASRFGDTIPLSFSASITFEQSYGLIDGDSASSAELYALLSSLSDVPIRQGIAVTGSVNQKGDVQAIGGVNEKIEGFYDVCRLRRLNGKQGVIIPESNVKNLMLHDNIVQAVKDKKFSIWAVSRIEDGIRLLTGVPAGIRHKDGNFTKDSVFDRVHNRLIEFSTRAKKFNKEIDQSLKKNSANSSSDDGEQ